MGGLMGLLLLAADIWAIVNIFQSRSSSAAKVVWTLVILVLPLLGFIVWLIGGPRSDR